ARCSLGSLGIVLSIGLFVRPQYIVEEHFAQYRTLDTVLAAEAEFPLQQFYLLPWRWDFFGQHRRESQLGPTPRAGLYHQYFAATFDYGMHLVIIPLVRWLRSGWLTRFFLGHILPLFVIRNWIVRDRSQAMLLMQHDLFRHIEIELFVTRSRLHDCLTLTRELLSYLSGASPDIPAAIRNRPELLPLINSVANAHGCYTHHYPICIRRVLPDDTLISMTAGQSEDSYAVSFISYERPDQREGFDTFATLMTQIATVLFAARPHWGKVCTIDHVEANMLYPDLDKFRSIAEQFDRRHQFRNAWVGRVLFGEKR
ncbi:MAG TPA: D-arabinono-1,4-lactone oxidase, partial [Caulifigura sp.]|nr:D-arabinono-1,4-lactone oxidase [Caulifigura sp.]